MGLVSGTCFAEMGNKVTCVDVNTEKIAKLKQGVIPIYEPGLEEVVQSNLAKTLFFTTDLAEAIKDAEIAFIAVGTPMGDDGSADLQYVLSVAQAIGERRVNSSRQIDRARRHCRQGSHYRASYLG